MTNRAFFETWFDEVWQKGNIDFITDNMHPDGKAYDFPRPGDVTDRDGFIAQARAFQQTFTGIRFEIGDIIIEGDKAAVRWTASMHHTGDGLGFAATGAPVTLSGVSVTHMRDGKVYEGWNALDLTAVVSHLRTLHEAA